MLVAAGEARLKKFYLVTQNVGLLGKSGEKVPLQPRPIKSILATVQASGVDYESSHGDYLVKEQDQTKRHNAALEHDEATARWTKRLCWLRINLRPLTLKEAPKKNDFLLQSFKKILQKIIKSLVAENKTTLLALSENLDTLEQPGDGC
jgi:hypothetical protein